MKAVDSSNFNENVMTAGLQRKDADVNNHAVLKQNNNEISVNNMDNAGKESIDEDFLKEEKAQQEQSVIEKDNLSNDPNKDKYECKSVYSVLNGYKYRDTSNNKLLSLKNNSENINDKSIICLIKNSSVNKELIKTSLESLNETDIRLERGSDERKSMNSNHSGNSSQITHLDTDHENDVDELQHSSPDAVHVFNNLQVDSGVESAASSWDRMAEVKEHAFARLQDELKKAHEELKLRDEEVSRLSRIRKEVETELEDLTASLFQEAHNMVREANMRRAAAEKALKESMMQIEVLTAEVSALKTLVLTSTPSRPNPHLHPQIDPKSKEDTNNCGSGLFRKQHRRSPSHFNLKYGRESSPPDSPTKEQQLSNIAMDYIDNKELLEIGIWTGNQSTASNDNTLLRQVDPTLHKEFLAWKQQPTMEKTDPFIARIYHEDINCCLKFNNTILGHEVKEAIENGSICIEAVSDKTKMHFPKKCALLESSRQCHYRMRFGDSETSYCISQLCRNRITAVCDCLNYLRYIQRGLVKCSVHDMYWEIVRLRKEIALARLGLTSTTSS